MPKGKNILEEIIANKLDVQVLVVCGRSNSFYQQVQSLQKKYPAFTIIAFHGFIDFIYDVINVSDIIITK
jgi:UDP-N-acetylglucosamine:LPS N-acetylglucosamine transferase